MGAAAEELPVGLAPVVGSDRVHLPVVNHE